MKHAKFIKHASTQSTQSTQSAQARKARLAREHVSTPSTWVRQARQLADSIVLKLNMETLVPS